MFGILERYRYRHKQRDKDIKGSWDSLIVLRLISKSKFEKGPPNLVIVNKISLQIENFEKISLFHILEHLNEEVNKLSNCGAELGKGIL